MSRIYLILGIIGWSAAAIVLPLYVWLGRRTKPRGFDVSATTKD